MNKEEILNKYIDLIDKGYCSDCNELNCIDNFPHAKITHGIRELQQENQELKKQLEEERNKVREYSYKLSNFRCEETYENQQKEFISYLEKEIDICDSFLDTVKSDSQEIPYGVISAGKTYITTRIKENETAHKVYEEILQKYKEIIGGKDGR